MTSIRKALAAATVAVLLGGPFGVFAATGGPTVTLSSSAAFTASPPTNITWADPIPFSVTISSSTSEFDATDVQVTGGTLLNFAGSGASYSFAVNPGDGDPAHDSQARYVRVEVFADKFAGNQASNVVEFWFDPASQPVDSQAPVITFTDPSPAQGATVNTASDTATTTGFTFAFSVDDASSSVKCSIVGSAEADSFYSCGSPQTFSGFPVGSYRFSVQATDTATNVATSSRTFTIAMGTAAATTTPPAATTTPSTTPATNSGGGSQPQPNGGGSAPQSGGGTQIVGSSPTAPSGNSSTPNASGFFNPNLIIPIPPNPPLVPSGSPTLSGNTSGSGSVSAAAPTAPRLASGSTSRTATLARAGTNPTAAVTTPAVPTSTVAAAEPTTITPAPGIPNTAGQTAAAGDTGSIPSSVWLWSAIVVLVLAAVGWLFYRAA